MSLTKKQKEHLLITGLLVLLAGMMSVVILATVSVLNSPSQAAVKTVPTPQVTAQNFEEIHTRNNDGTVDHYCLGSLGLFFGQYTGEFSVVKGDPLCSG